MSSIYILQKLLSILILFRLGYLYGIVSIFLFFVILFFKEPSLDIINYVKLVSSENQYELFYSRIIDIFYFFTNDSKLSIFFYQLFLVCVASSISFFFRDNKILIISVIISSVAMMLAIHNNLRQGTACIFILLGIIFYIKNYKKLGILTTLISIGFHHASIHFIILFCVLGIIYKFLFSKNLYKKNIKMYYIFFIAVLLAIFFSNLINLLINYSQFSLYLEMDLSFNNPNRVAHLTKIVILIFFWLSTEMILKFHSIDNQIDFLRFLRQFLILVTFFLSLSKSFYEISNRILYMYYIIEMGLLCFYVDRKMFNITVFMIISYGFAFNVWTVLS